VLGGLRDGGAGEGVTSQAEDWWLKCLGLREVCGIRGRGAV
jgi:hypothetical protein